MSKYFITVEVDDEELRNATGAKDEETIEGLVEQEMGWVGASGIYVVSVEETME